MALEWPRRCWSFSGGHWRGSCLLFAMVIVFVQFYVISIRNPLLVHRTLKTTYEEKISTLSDTSTENTLTNIRQGKSKVGPLSVLLVSYARTGSSFVGDLLQSLPDTFYYFEPLHFVRNSVLNDSFEEARSVLDKVFNCNVTKIDGFIKWQQAHTEFMKFKRSRKYWQECSKKNACFNGSYLESRCRKHATVVVKTIRLNLREAVKMFLSHPHLNLKIIYLMRDPRGTINSRWKYPVSSWCQKDLTCASSKYFCSTLNEDMSVICSSLKERPEDVHVLRYEDLAMDPLATTGRLVEFLGLPSIPKETEMFLKTHTFVSGDLKKKSHKVQGVDYPYSTFRNSSITALSWRRQMTMERVTELQGDCGSVLKGMGYFSYSTLGVLRSNVNLDEQLEVALNTHCTVD